MKEMKTLNGYEVVDAKARQDIATISVSIPTVPTKVSQLENDSKYATEGYVDEAVANAGGGGSSSGSGVTIYRLEGNTTETLTAKDKEILLYIYNAIKADPNHLPPEDTLLYVKTVQNKYALVTQITANSWTDASTWMQIYVPATIGAGRVQQYIWNVRVENGTAITTYISAGESLQTGGGVEFDEQTGSSYDFTAYADNYNNSYVGDSGYDADKVVAMIALILVDGKRHYVPLLLTNLYNTLCGQTACIYNGNTHILYLDYYSGYLGYEVKNTSGESLSFTFEGYSFIKNK